MDDDSFWFLRDYLDAVDEYVERMYPPEEVEIRLQQLKLVGAIERYLAEIADGE